MAINFAAASTAGLNNPGTEIITLVKDESGNFFINPPSYDKMRAYLRSGEVPMLFVTDEAGETGSLYQLAEYSETENKIRFGNDKTTIEFSAGGAAPVVSEVGGGGSGSGQFIVVVYSTNLSGATLAADKTYDEITAAIESGAAVVIHKKKNINSAAYQVFYHVDASAGGYQFCNNTHAPGETTLTTRFINIGVENGEMYIDSYSYNLQPVT